MRPQRSLHSILTDLTQVALTDAQIALVSGHSTKKSLEVYQSVSLSDVADDYQTAMQKK